LSPTRQGARAQQVEARPAPPKWMWLCGIGDVSSTRLEQLRTFAASLAPAVERDAGLSADAALADAALADAALADAARPGLDATSPASGSADAALGEPLADASAENKSDNGV